MQKLTIGSDVQDHLNQLRFEHARLEKRLHELDRHLSLSPEEQKERTDLKKAKLHLKDDIARFTRLRF
jgi:uncharacterized protein YdcH (DUF465 family)